MQLGDTADYKSTLRGLRSDTVLVVVSSCTRKLVPRIISLSENSSRAYFREIVQTISPGKSPLTSTRLAYGCWRLASNKEDPNAGRRAVTAAYEAGYTLFDNADIYGGGEAEKMLGAALKEISGMRQRVF